VSDEQNKDPEPKNEQAKDPEPKNEQNKDPEPQNEQNKEVKDSAVQAETGTLSDQAADKAAASTTSETTQPAKAKPTPAVKPAAPKKAPPPPDPRALAAKEIAEKLKQSLVSSLGEACVEETGAAHFKPMVRIRKEDWANAVELLRTHPEWKLNYLEMMAGTDYKDYIEVVIYVQSIELGHFLCLKTRTDREEAKLPSLVSSHAGVNWEEREIYDLLGVNFTNHPDLRRIMMWDEFKGHPLSKDYSEWD